MKLTPAIPPFLGNDHIRVFHPIFKRHRRAINYLFVKKLLSPGRVGSIYRFNFPRKLRRPIDHRLLNSTADNDRSHSFLVQPVTDHRKQIQLSPCRHGSPDNLNIEYGTYTITLLSHITHNHSHIRNFLLGYRNNRSQKKQQESGEYNYCKAYFIICSHNSYYFIRNISVTPNLVNPK